MKLHRDMSQTRVSSVALLLALGIAMWSGRSWARADGYIGHTYYSHTGPNPVWSNLCTYTASVECSYCGNGTWNPYGNMTEGCSNISYEHALREASNTCMSICLKAQAEKPVFGAYLPGGASVGTSNGAATVSAVHPGLFTGRIPGRLEEQGMFDNLDVLVEHLITQTGNAWLWLEGQAEHFSTMEGGYHSAAYTEAYWSEQGAPEPRTECATQADLECPCQDGGLGDRILACSQESEDEARSLAESACPRLCYMTRSTSWMAWGLAGDQESEEGEEESAQPLATILAVEPGVFLGYVGSSLEPIGPTDDWVGLTSELLELTQGTRVWLAGPEEYYLSNQGAVCEGAAR